MTKKWYFTMSPSDTGGIIEFTTADTAKTGTSYLITAASGRINGKTIVGLVPVNTSLYGRTVQNYVRSNDPYSIGLIDSEGNKYFFTSALGVYIFAPSSDTGTWQQYDAHSYEVFTESTSPTPTPVTSGPTEGADTLTGTSGNDTINALGGNDTINGGSGNDTINAGDGDDTIALSAGVDTIEGGNGADTLTLTGDLTANSISYNISTQVFSVRNEGYTSTFTNIEKIAVSGTTYSIVKPASTTTTILTGTSGSDFLFGGSGRDALNGGAGADVMQGGSGDDIYYVDNTSDQIIEGAEGGIDEVQSSVNFTLAANLETLSLTGTANINGTGNDLDNYIYGNDGNNILDGKAGHNYLIGRKGNDTFVISGPGENEIDAGEGVDTLKFALASQLQDWRFYFGGDVEVSFSCETTQGAMQAWVANNGTLEMVSFTSSTGANTSYALVLGKGNKDVSLVGSSKVDLLIADNGRDTLNGGSGADVMFGGGSDDTYMVDNVGDMVIETEAPISHGGRDLVRSSLATYTLATNVEDLTLVGRGLNGVGNILDNILTGNINKNTLSGGDGSDTLIGGTGQDTLTGGAGTDIFKFTQLLDSAVKTPDKITDFVSGTDKVDLSGIDANSLVASDQAFTFIGSAAFSKVAGQLRFASGVLTGDTNGDGVADFQINMTGVSVLLVSDIVL